MPFAPPSVRFWRRVDKSGPTMPHMTTPCWTWTGGKNTEGYGYIWVDGKNQRVHHWLWEQENGPISPGNLLRHHCDNTSCVRLSHMLLGTDQDNMNDMRARGREHHPKGVLNNNAKLTDEDIRSIRRSYVRGVTTLEEVAKKFGTSPPNVSLIVRRKIWAHVQ